MAYTNTPSKIPLAHRLAAFAQAPTVWRPVGQGSVACSNGWFVQPRLQMQPICQGFELGFFVNLTFTVKNNGANAVTLTNAGLANMVSRIKYTDPSGVTRVDVSGLGLEQLTTVRQGRAIGASNQIVSDYPATPAKLQANSAPASLAPWTTETYKYTLYLPLCKDLSTFGGCVPAFGAGSSQTLEIEWANVNLATNNVNPAKIDGVFVGGLNTAPNLSLESCTYDTVMLVKDFGLQQDTTNGTIAAPWELIDEGYFISERYETGLTSGGEKLIPLTFNRNYYNILTMVDQGTVTTNGTDVTTIKELAAGNNAIFEGSPAIHQLKTGLSCENNLMQGVYAFTWNTPLNVANYGGQYNLSFKMAQAVAGSRIRVVEEYSSETQRTYATSLK